MDWADPTSSWVSTKFLYFALSYKQISKTHKTANYLPALAWNQQFVHASEITRTGGSFILEFSFSNTWNRQFFDFAFFFKYPKLEIIHKKKTNTPTLEQTADGYQGDYAGSYWWFSKNKNQRISSNNVQQRVLTK